MSRASDVASATRRPSLSALGVHAKVKESVPAQWKLRVLEWHLQQPRRHGKRDTALFITVCYDHSTETSTPPTSTQPYRKKNTEGRGGGEGTGGESGTRSSQISALKVIGAPMRNAGHVACILLYENIKMS